MKAFNLGSLLALFLIMGTANPALSELACHDLFADKKSHLLATQIKVEQKLQPGFIKEIEDVLKMDQTPGVWTQKARENTLVLSKLLQEVDSFIKSQGSDKLEARAQQILLNKYRNQLTQFLDGRFDFQLQTELMLNIHQLWQFAKYGESHFGGAEYSNPQNVFSFYKLLFKDTPKLATADGLVEALEKSFEHNNSVNVNGLVPGMSLAGKRLWFTTRELSFLELLYAASRGIHLVGLIEQDYQYVDGYKYTKLDFLRHDLGHAKMHAKYGTSFLYFYNKIFSQVDDKRIALAFLILHEDQNMADKMYENFKKGVVHFITFDDIWIRRLQNENDMKSLMSGITESPEDFLAIMRALFQEIFRNAPEELR